MEARRARAPRCLFPQRVSSRRRDDTLRVGQAEYVRWWDSQKKDSGRFNSSRQRDELKGVGKDGIPDKDTLHRWRKILKDLHPYENGMNRDKG